MKRLVMFLCFALTGFNLNSQWSTDPAENNIISSNTLFLADVSDMQNGIIVVTQTHFAFPVIYAQRMSVDGRRLWPGNEGIKITDSSQLQWLVHWGYMDKEFVMSDNTGGCYIAFHLARFIGMIGDADHYDVGLYLQRLDSKGNRLFGTNGLTIMPEEKDSTRYDQRMLHWCLDGNNGLYINWYRITIYAPESNGTYLAHISNTGEFIWGPIRVYPIQANYIPFIDVDHNLNVYFYKGESIPKIPDRFIKISGATGEILSEKEIEIGVGEFGFNNFNKYCISTNYSIIFVFRDFRTDTLRIQKLDAAGNKLWGNDPIIISPEIERKRQFQIKSDQHGGAYVLYKTPDNSFHLVHFDNFGNKLWDHIIYTSGGGITEHNELISVGNDANVFILKGQMQYLIKVNFEGDIIWETRVTDRKAIATEISYSDLEADSIGGCIVSWQEIGSQFYGLRGQRINYDGHPGNPTNVMIAAGQNIKNQVNIKSIYPNPFNDSVSIRFSLNHEQNVSLKVFNLLGKEVKRFESRNLVTGNHTVCWGGDDNNGRPLSSGIYFFVMQANYNRISKKVILIR